MTVVAESTAHGDQNFNFLVTFGRSLTLVLLGRFWWNIKALISVIIGQENRKLSPDNH